MGLGFEPCALRAQVTVEATLAAIVLLNTNSRVIAHSKIIDNAVAFLLIAEGATVTVRHHLTRSVSMHSRHADAVFVAVGKPRLITAEMIKPGAAVIDIGINRVAGPDGQTVTVGDVDYQSCRAVARWITPAPWGGAHHRGNAYPKHSHRSTASTTSYERESSTSADHPPFGLSRL